MAEDTLVEIDDEEESTFYLKAVVSVRSIKHFVHLWIKKAKTLKKRRYLLLLLTRGQILNAPIRAIICRMLP